MRRRRNAKNAHERVQARSGLMVLNPTDYKGKWRELFGNNNPIHLEIGMGKGNFILDKAKKNPNINFIGLEKYDSIVCRALEKAEVQQPSNLKIMCIDALELADIFDKEIDVIYLNFSDPWPKKRHAKRRLTSHVFLPIYDKLFRKLSRKYDGSELSYQIKQRLYVKGFNSNEIEKVFLKN